jgi:hypothetical protein
MPRTRNLYQPTPEEIQIIQLAENNPNYFTDWFIRGSNTGTWLGADNQDSRYQKMYRLVFDQWNDEGKPQTMWFDYDSHTMPKMIMPSWSIETQVRHDYRTGKPLFWLNHGFVFQEWQLEWYFAPQHLRVVIGGMGSGKTVLAIMGMLVRAATLPGYRGLALAPYAIQSAEVYKKARMILSGTAYENKFLLRSPERPYPLFVIGHSLIGESVIECYSIQDDSDKVLTFEADEAFVDQAEMLPSLQDARESIATRLRGRHQSRERLCIQNYVANPRDNQELWDMFDDAEEFPDRIYAKRVSSYDNAALSESQLSDYEFNIRDAATKEQKLHGHRPVGDGIEFPASSVKRCISEHLDNKMEKLLKDKVTGTIYIKQPKVGIVRWELPYEEKHVYLTIADPGQDNPPKRNAAVVGTWDITYCPDQPAQLVAFNWVYGNGEPDPWIQSFYDQVVKYRTIGRCAFDSTGLQSGYQRWVEIFNQVLSENINLGGSGKYTAVNAGKVLMAKGKIAFPTIPAIISQLAKYETQKDKDTKLAQDIVMFICMTCAWLERVFYFGVVENNERAESKERELDRHAWHNTASRESYRSR